MRAIALFVFILSMTVSCCRNSMEMKCPDIVPFPQEMSLASGTFCVAGADISLASDLDSLSKAYIHSFAAHLSKVTGVAQGEGRGKISFRIDKSIQSSDSCVFFRKNQSYSIEVSRKRVLVKAGCLNGFVYAGQ